MDFRELPRTNSLISRLDPRWKLAAAALLLIALACVQGLPAALAGLAVCLLLAIVARLPWRWYLGRMGGLFAFLALFTLPLPFFVEGPGWSASWGPVTFSLHGLVVGLTLAARAASIVSVALVVLATAPLEDNLKAARSLWVPGVLVQLLLLSYRYVHLLVEELNRLRVALRVRGYRQRLTAHSFRTVAHTAATLFVRGHDRAERVAHAMRCRGFDGRFRTLSSFVTRPRDVAAFAAVTFVAVGLVLLDRFPP